MTNEDTDKKSPDSEKEKEDADKEAPKNVEEKAPSIGGEKIEVSGLG
jgi:hypothetical protein